MFTCIPTLEFAEKRSQLYSEILCTSLLAMSVKASTSKI